MVLLLLPMHAAIYINILWLANKTTLCIGTPFIASKYKTVEQKQDARKRENVLGHRQRNYSVTQVNRDQCYISNRQYINHKIKFILNQ